ncbi:Uncharacterised protein [Pragia fontium]|nr:Uncharacterised protein [Pragia fontium]
MTQGADTLTLRKIIPTSIERDNQNRITGYNSLIGLGDIRGKYYSRAFMSGSPTISDLTPY